MCFFMAWITGIKRIVYGATIKDASKTTPQIKVSNKLLNKKGGNKIKLKGKFMRKECKKLFGK